MTLPTDKVLALAAVKEKPNEIDPNKWAFDRGLESY